MGLRVWRSRSCCFTNRKRMADCAWWQWSTSFRIRFTRVMPHRRCYSASSFSRSMVSFSFGDSMRGSGRTIRAGSSRHGIRTSIARTPRQPYLCPTRKFRSTGEADAKIPHRTRDTERRSALCRGAEGDLAEVLQRTERPWSEHSMGAELCDGGQDYLRLHCAECGYNPRACEEGRISGGSGSGDSDDYRSFDGGDKRAVGVLGLTIRVSF